VGAFEHVRCLTACLLHYDPASYSSQARLSVLRREAEAKASLQGRGSESSWKSVAVDPKPKRSTHVQDEAWVTPGGGPNP
jgi:hypothetical protein